eukprot:1623195-Amphidinium_carterae.6
MYCVALANDFEIPLQPEVSGHAAAAIASRGEALVKRVGTHENVDALTKPLGRDCLRKHMRCIGFEYRVAWSILLRAVSCVEALKTDAPQRGGVLKYGMC